MIYQSLLRKLTVEKNKISNFQQQNSVERVKEMVQSLAIPLIDAHIVEVMEELDLIKDFLQFNKPALNATEMEKKSPILVMIAMVKAKNRHLKKYL